jgi:hypothetical protein
MHCHTIGNKLTESCCHSCYHAQTRMSLWLNICITCSITHSDTLSKLSLLLPSHTIAALPMPNHCYYRRHRQYLERSLQLLGERFSRDVASHRDDNLRVMQDNMLLIKEINEQRDKNRSVKRALQAQVCNAYKLINTSAVKSC